MVDISLQTTIILCVTAMAAGWVDAIVGGGGLIQIPALLLALPGLPAATIVGTNKAMAVVGTSAASITYARRSPLHRTCALIVGIVASVAATFGALIAHHVPGAMLRPIILVFLLLISALIVLRPQFGGVDPTTAPKPITGLRRWGLICTGIGIGFYDGVLGSGTGTLLAVALAGLARLNFLTATATAKVINVAINITGIAVFAVTGNIVWQLAIVMAIANLIGGTLGAKIALNRGAGFIRAMLLVIVLILVCKLGYDQWH